MSKEAQYILVLAQELKDKAHKQGPFHPTVTEDNRLYKAYFN